MPIRRLTLTLILCMCGLTISAFGQESPKRGPTEEERAHAQPAAPNEPTLYTFPLHEAQAEQVLQTIQSVLVKTQDGVKDNAHRPSPRFAVDTRLNRIIAFVDPPTKRLIEALLLKLDQPVERASAEPKVMALKLHFASPGNVLEAIHQLVFDQRGINCYADERTKTFFARGTEEGLTRLKALVERLDVAPTTTRPRECVSLRIVWLADKSLAGPDAAPVPNEWAGSIERLRKQIGFGELRMATQMVVGFDPVDGAQFESTALVKLQQPCMLEASGRMNQKGPGDSQLRLQLSAKTLPQANHEGKLTELCKLDTTCSGALQWQPMIVGMTTVGSQPSVFVIQFLPN
jgi:hypothetical protein